ncbi:amino acid ABC transporter permease [Desulfohalovibrio reitneri]|uniref:amino acid ABC transporter permease n=1 Tax=Desulfohalovibrio reitneri TaxID=1307759 RepID=UPI0004A70562|nr:amino acid ABC transporter permease [Desulfohalovibrio reitneri]
MLPGKPATFTRLDLLLGLLLAAGAAWLVLRAGANLDYDWDWSVVSRYLVKTTPDGVAPNLLLEGLFTTIKLALWSMLLALPVGTIAGLARARGRLGLRLLARVYVEFVRNTPPLVLIFIFYFFVGDQVMTALGVQEAARALPDSMRQTTAWLAAEPGRLAAFASAVLTLGLYEGAYIAEIVRSGVQSIERGQWEAAYALGLSPWQRMRRVVLPQAFRRIVPPLAGQFISTIKDSAIVSVISIGELTFQGMEIMATTYQTFEIWLTVLGMYLALCLTLSLLSRRLEAYLARWGF